MPADPTRRPVRIVIEAMVPNSISEGAVLAAMPQLRWIAIEDGDGTRKLPLRYRRWSALIAPLAAVEAAAKALETGGAAFSIIGTLRGAIRQLKGN